MKNQSWQSALAAPMKAFLSYHRALGKRFNSEEGTLRLFDRFVAGQNIRALAALTPGLIDAFVCSRNRPSAKSHNQLIGVLQRWFAWLAMQQRIESSPVRIVPRKAGPTRKPFLFDATLLRRVIVLAGRLVERRDTKGRALVYPMLFALIGALGLRVSEATRLRVGDIDWGRGVLHIEKTKFFKSRLVPIGPKITARLRLYMKKRGMRAAPSDTPVFWIGRAPLRPIGSHHASCVFGRLCRQLHIEAPLGVAPARLHSLRHSFAVRTLLGWYRQGISPGERLMDLATFMGHANPSSTSVYLTITPELLEEANRRFRNFASPITKGGRP